MHIDTYTTHNTCFIFSCEICDKHIHIASCEYTNLKQYGKAVRKSFNFIVSWFFQVLPLFAIVGIIFLHHTNDFLVNFFVMCCLSHIQTHNLCLCVNIYNYHMNRWDPRDGVFVVSFFLYFIFGENSLKLEESRMHGNVCVTR